MLISLLNNPLFMSVPPSHTKTFPHCFPSSVCYLLNTASLFLVPPLSDCLPSNSATPYTLPSLSHWHTTTPTATSPTFAPLTTIPPTLLLPSTFPLTLLSLPRWSLVHTSLHCHHIGTEDPFILPPLCIENPPTLPSTLPHPYFDSHLTLPSIPHCCCFQAYTLPTLLPLLHYSPSHTAFLYHIATL